MICLEFRCPKCREELPWWWKAVAGGRVFGYVFECKHCNALIEIKMKKKEKWMMAPIVFVMAVLMADALKEPDIIIQKIGLSREVAAAIVYLIIPVMLFYRVRFVKYDVRLVEDPAHRREVSVLFSVAVVSVGAIMLTVLAILIYLKYGEMWMFYACIIVFIAIFILYKRECSKIERLRSRKR